MKISPTQNNFSGGEWAPSLYGRTDQKKYGSACRLVRNWIIQPHGGASTRPGTYFVAPLVDETERAYFVPFQFNAAENYVLVFGHQSMSVVKGYDFIRNGIQDGFDAYALTALQAIRKADGSHINLGEEVYGGSNGIWVEGTHNATLMDVNTTVAGKLVITLNNSLTDLSYAGDTPPKVLKNVHGDFSIGCRCQFTSAPGAGYRLMSGLTLRDTLDPIARQIAVGLYQETTGSFYHRSWTTGVSATDVAASNAEFWYRIARVGSTFTTYYATNVGSVTPTWVQIAQYSISHMADDVQLGMFSTANYASCSGYRSEFREFQEVAASYGDPYTIDTVYDIDDMPKVKFAQTADTLYLTHPSYTTQKLTRTADDDWTIADVTYGTSQAKPTALVNTGTKAISGITQADPGVITTSKDHELADGDVIIFENVGGMVELNGNRYRVDVDTVTTFHLHALNGDTRVDTTTFTAYTSGGTVRLAEHAFVVTATSDDGEESLPSTLCLASTDSQISWTAPTGAAWYSIYKDPGGTHGFYGWVADVSGTSHIIENVTPDWEKTPPIDFDFTEVVGPTLGTFPGCCAFFEQRMVYARSNDFPQTVWGSHIGRYDNFNTSHSPRDDESYEFTLDARQQNEILWVLPLDRLLIGTTGNEWRMDGGSGSDTITPTSVNVRMQSQWGCADIAPLIIGDTVVYVQYGSKNIRELAYSLESDRFIGNDITILANHLFKTRTISSWCYQRMPRSVIWCVMSDGKLLGLTYLKEQMVWAWHQHQTDGTYEDCCVIPDGSGNDLLYLLVNRTIDGATRRYIEVMQEIETVDVTDAFCVDSGLTYDSTATTTVYGLQHLEGETVVALADGFVHMGLTVTDGAVTLPNSASTIHVGLPYTCDLETLDFAPSTETETISNRVRRIVSTSILFDASASLSIGPDSSHLQEIIFRTSEGLDEVVPLYTGTKQLQPKTGDPDESRLWLRVSNPLPCTVLSIIARMDVGSER